MARKKSETAGSDATTSATKGAKKGGVKKKTAAKAGSVATETAAKSGTPKGTKKSSAAAGGAGATTKKGATGTKAAAKKPAIKLNDKQRDLLKRVQQAGEGGYSRAAKPEERSLEALRERKLVKRGAKNKETGIHPYQLTKAGEKHLSTEASNSSS